MRQSLIRVKTSCRSLLTGSSWVMSCHQNPSQLFGFLNHFVSENGKVTCTFPSELTTKMYVYVYCVLIYVIRDNALFCRKLQMFSQFRHVTSVSLLRFFLQQSIIHWTSRSLIVVKYALHWNSVLQQGLQTFITKAWRIIYFRVF